MKQLIAAIVMASFATTAHAELTAEEIFAPVAVGVATVKVMRTPYLNKRGNTEPINSLSHIAVGAAVGYYMREKYGWKAALASGIVIGVGKELADKHFDAKDAAMTILGSVMSVTVHF